MTTRIDSISSTASRRMVRHNLTVRQHNNVQTTSPFMGTLTTITRSSTRHLIGTRRVKGALRHIAKRPRVEQRVFMLMRHNITSFTRRNTLLLNTTTPALRRVRRRLRHGATNFNDIRLLFQNLNYKENERLVNLLFRCHTLELMRGQEVVGVLFKGRF